MAIKFVTGNKNKFVEVQRILDLPIEQIDIDLPEIQSIDAHEIIRQKLLSAEEHSAGEYVVEDTSLYFDCLGGKLPGPLIKWFREALGNDGMADLALRFKDMGATAQTCVGYANEDGEIHFFDGDIKGKIVIPRGSTNFGWDPIFEPEGENRTLAEMTADEKNAISSRGQAFRKLKDFLFVKN